MPAIDWELPAKLTVLVPAVNRLVLPLNAVELKFVSLRMLLPPLSDPPRKFTSPVNVWVNPAPRFNVPVPEPLIVSGPPFTLPWKVALPADFVKLTVPVVVKPAIDWVAVVPAMVTPPVPLVNVPAFMKSP